MVQISSQWKQNRLYFKVRPTSSSFMTFFSVVTKSRLIRSQFLLHEWLVTDGKSCLTDIYPDHISWRRCVTYFILRLKNDKLSWTYHSIASSRPSPLVAEVLNMDHVRLFSAERPRALETSEADMAPSISWWQNHKNSANQLTVTGDDNCSNLKEYKTVCLKSTIWLASLVVSLNLDQTIKQGLKSC